MTTPDVAAWVETVGGAVERGAHPEDTGAKARAALDSLVAHIEQVEREREAVGENADSTLRLYEAAEARVRELEEALNEGLAILEVGHDYDVMLLRSLDEWAEKTHRTLASPDVETPE